MELDIELVNSYCDEALDLLSRWETIGLELSKNEDKELYQELFRIAHNIKGGSRAVGLMAYGDFVHKVEDGITLLRDGTAKLNPSILTLILEAQKILVDWTSMLKLEPMFVNETESFLLQFERAFSNTSEVSATTSVTPQATLDETAKETEPAHESESKRDLPTKSVPSEKKKANHSSNETIRIQAQKLDELIQVIGELSIHQSIVWHTRNTETANNKMFLNSLQLGQKLTKELYDKALSLRMQPIQSVFQRLERNILDLSRGLNKDVNVQIIGGEVELDKTVIERIIDPLTHIVRNAIDHGIETIEDRVSANKSAKGSIQISAKQDTFGVELIIQDDGKGLASEKIQKKAIEKGLISAEQNLNKKDIYNLIFLPGFSTAEKVTDVSGRGVGMDVVRRTLEELQGSIQIDSEAGKGTQFQITLPTSVSIIDAMLVELSGQNYVIPVGSVDEVITLDKPISSSVKMLNHNQTVLPLEDLDRILKGQKSHRSKGKSEFKTIIVCHHQNKKLGLAIDRVVGQQQIVIRPLNENIDGAFGLMGGTILGNGEPGLIIDIPALSDYFIRETQKVERSA